MSGSINKKLHSYRKVITTNVKKSAPKYQSQKRGDEQEDIRREYILNTIGERGLSMDQDLVYELITERGDYESIWDAPSLKQYKDVEQKQIEESLYKNDFIEEGIYTCKRCNCKRVTVVSKQIRSADEGESTFITCVSCKLKWRID
jgi:DNA-directed RNA polymerase subunit M/transcription elongation factor TFIIS